MSRYRLSLLTVLAVLFLVGCTPQGPAPESGHEDEYALIAYDALLQKEYDTAYHYFDALYEETGSSVYLKESLRILTFQKKYDEVIRRAGAFLQESDDDQIRRLLIESYKEKEAYDAAIGAAKKLVENTGSEESYIITAELYLLKKEYEKSIEYYKQAYDINPSDYVVDKIAETLYIYLKESEEAIQYYESHIRFHGCGKYLCQRLASLYARNGDIDGVINTYRRLYEIDDDEIIGRKVIDLYLLKNDYKGLQEFWSSLAWTIRCC